MNTYRFPLTSEYLAVLAESDPAPEDPEDEDYSLLAFDLVFDEIAAGDSRFANLSGEFPDYLRALTPGN